MIASDCCLGTPWPRLGSRVLRVVLYGVSNLDPIGYAAALVVLSAIVAIAALLPLAAHFASM